MLKYTLRFNRHNDNRLTIFLKEPTSDVYRNVTTCTGRCCWFFDEFLVRFVRHTSACATSSVTAFELFFWRLQNPFWQSLHHFSLFNVYDDSYWRRRTWIYFMKRDSLKCHVHFMWSLNLFFLFKKPLYRICILIWIRTTQSLVRYSHIFLRW